jgi:ssDNA-binding Zn-finger/Zn-ribbon topoisomerase 1
VRTRTKYNLYSVYLHYGGGLLALVLGAAVSPVLALLVWPPLIAISIWRVTCVRCPTCGFRLSSKRRRRRWLFWRIYTRTLFAPANCPHCRRPLP